VCALLTFTPTHAVARSLSVACAGTIQTHTLSAYTAITAKDGENVCIFVTGSPEGKRILKICPIGSACVVEGAAQNSGDNNEIYKVESVRRTGTPDLDAKAKAAKEADDKRKSAALKPYADAATACVMNYQGKLAEVLGTQCAKQNKELRAAYFKLYGPGGNYLYYDYFSNLSKERDSWE
jgi:hypothetical protein